MTAADTLARLCRAVGVSAPALTAQIVEEQPCAKMTKKRAKELRMEGAPIAYEALESLLLDRARGIACLGIDPGKKGAMVGLDESGAVVLEVALVSLFADEAPNGPSARKAAYNEEQARIKEANRTRSASRQLRGRKKKPTSIKGSRTRLIPVALDWLFLHVRPQRVVLEGLLFHNLTVRSEDAWRMSKGELIAQMNRAREGVKSTATMAVNWDRLYVALRRSGLDVTECTPSVWQAGWSSKDDAERLFPLEEHGDTQDRQEMMADPKARSIAAARLAGYDCGTNDALADAFGLARWGMRA